MADTLSHILLFNDKRYQRCNLGVGQRLFRYDHLAGDRLVGTLSGVVEDGVLDCGHSAPFGGVDWVRRREPVGSIVGLIRAAAARARRSYPHNTGARTARLFWRERDRGRICSGRPRRDHRVLRDLPWDRSMAIQDT